MPHEKKTKERQIKFCDMEYFGGMNDRHVIAYFEWRSSTYMWCVYDLDHESMSSFSTKINKA